jgi:hypothetical protein
LNDVRAISGFPSPFHPRLPGLEGPVALDALGSHLFVVSFDANDLWMNSNVCEQTRRGWSTVDHVAKTDHPVFRPQLKSMNERFERGEMSVDVPYDQQPMTFVKPCL